MMKAAAGALNPIFIAKKAGEATASMAQEYAEGVFDVFEKRSIPLLQKTVKDSIYAIANPTNAITLGGLLGLASAIAITGAYGTKAFWSIIEKRFISPGPEILLEGSRYGYWDRAKRWWSGASIAPMVFSPQVKDVLDELIAKTKAIRTAIQSGSKTTVYRNVLLYGKPGTGKTMLTRVLADRTDMDFLVTTGARLLQSGISGVKYFDDLIALAKHSTHGCIIFIDEAGGLFVDRKNLEYGSAHYQLLDHIIAVLGNDSNKFMIVAATNHPENMDPAMVRRFKDTIFMPLPDEDTRFELIKLYAHMVLFNSVEHGAKFIVAAKKVLSDQIIRDIAQKTAGLSHAEVKDIVFDIQAKALVAPSGVVTAQIIDQAVANGVAKQ
jgi:ATPase family AAA domain-containing protein 3A/B